MKLICNGTDLADGFTKVIKAISSKKNIPILDGVKLSADGNILTLTATDTELTIINKISADVIVEGDIIIDGKFGAELTRKTLSQSIEINCVDSSFTTFKYVDSTSKVKCMSIEEFPLILEVNGYKIKIKKKNLKKIIDSIIFSAAVEDARPLLKGCYIEIDGKTLTAVALDGYRMALVKQLLDEDCGKRSLVVPSRTLIEISKLLDDSEDIINLTLSDKKIMAEIDNTIVISSLLEGNYIKFRNIIPQAFNTECVIMRQNFDEIIDRASIISRRDKSNLISLEISENVMIMRAKSDIGDIVEKMTINTNGMDVLIGLNGKYLADCINVLKDDFIKLSIVSSTEPCIIRPLEGDDYLYLILPVRVFN